MTTNAERLVAQHGVWGEHPDYPVADWQLMVANDETRQGYWEWIASELELAADDNPNSLEN